MDCGRQDENGQAKVNTLSAVRRGKLGPAMARPPTGRDGCGWSVRASTSLRWHGVAYPGYVVGLHMLASDRSGRRYDLTVVIKPEVVSRLLGRQALPGGWYSGVLDQNGRIIGRNVGSERYTGRLATPDMLRAMKLNPSGVRESVSLEGVKTLSAFDRSALTGWTVAVAMPRSEATGYLSRSLRLLALGSIALLLIGGTLELSAGARLPPWRSSRASTCCPPARRRPAAAGPGIADGTAGNRSDRPGHARGFAPIARSRG